MVDPATTRRLGYRALYILVAVLILFVRILPLSTLPTRYPGPDLILCTTLVWLMRRPDHVPVVAIVAVFLMEDLISMRPPGLWSLIALVATEFLRSRQTSMRETSFALEWLIVGAIMAAMAVTNALVLALFMVPQSSPGYVALQVLTTIAAYPAVAAIAQFGLGVHRVAPGEVDAFGHRV
jgi:rod shape-determining protein MreD